MPAEIWIILPWIIVLALIIYDVTAEERTQSLPTGHVERSRKWWWTHSAA